MYEHYKTDPDFLSLKDELMEVRKKQRELLEDLYKKFPPASGEAWDLHMITGEPFVMNLPVTDIYY